MDILREEIQWPAQWKEKLGAFFFSPKISEITVTYCCAWSLSHVHLLASPWTRPCQASLSMEFFRQEY